MNALDDEFQQYLKGIERYSGYTSSRDCGPVDNPMQLPRSIHQ